jgi:acyl carrier protein
MLRKMSFCSRRRIRGRIISQAKPFSQLRAQITRLLGKIKVVAGNGDQMQKEQVIETINNLLIEEFEVEEEQLQPDENLMETLEIDSLDLVDLVVIIEKNFGFKVVPEEMTEIKTLQDFYDFVAKRAQ